MHGEQPNHRVERMRRGEMAEEKICVVGVGRLGSVVMWSAMELSTPRMEYVLCAFRAFISRNFSDIQEERGEYEY